MTDEKFCYNDVLEAHRRIMDYVVETPLEESFYLGTDQRRYFFKLESFQRVKSFKIRGALNKMLSLSEEEKAKGVATVSSGNHGSAVSYGASLLGIKKAIVIVPENTPQSKIDRIVYFGGEVVKLGRDYDEAHNLGNLYIEKNGMTYIDAYYDDPKIYGGQGTIAIEILEQNPNIDTIVVPIGGGGLITGVAVAAKAIKPGVKVVGVQTEACPAMIKSYEDDKFYSDYPSKESLCDALVGGIGALSYEMAINYVDDFLSVSEETIGKAVSFMAKQEKYVVETGSCTTVAAIMEQGDRIGGKEIALILSGGNIDGELLKDLICRYP